MRLNFKEPNKKAITTLLSGSFLIVHLIKSKYIDNKVAYLLSLEVNTGIATIKWHYSHSIVAGGLLDISYTTLFTFSTSLVILYDTLSSTS